MIVTADLMAQFPGAAPGGKGNAQAMNIGHVYGKIVDSTGKAQINEDIKETRVRYTYDSNTPEFRSASN